MRSLVRRLSRYHATAAAYVALFAALGGGAYATYSITSEDIVDETIRSEDIGTQQVTTDEIGKTAVTLDRMHDFSVNSAKVVDNTLTNADIATGGVTHYEIANGTVRSDDLALTTVTQVSDSAPAMTKTVTATCPSGKRALGGGGEILREQGDSYSDPENLVSIAKSAPTGAGNGWTVRGEVTDHPGIPEFTFAYDGDYVIGFGSYIVEDNFTYTGTWAAKAWAICA
jgi:hypothetical protein